MYLRPLAGEKRHWIPRLAMLTGNHSWRFWWALDLMQPGFKGSAHARTPQD